MIVACPAPPATDKTSRPCRRCPGVIVGCAARWEEPMILDELVGQPHLSRASGNPGMQILFWPDLLKARKPWPVAGHSLCRHPGLCAALSGGMVEQDSAIRSAPPRGTALSTAGRIAGLAARGARGVFGREPET